MHTASAAWFLMVCPWQCKALAWRGCGLYCATQPFRPHSQQALSALQAMYLEKSVCVRVQLQKGSEYMQNRSS